MNVRWRASRTGALAIKRWNDEFTVYDATSGDTHLIGLLAGELLCAIETAGPWDTTQLVAAMAELLGELPNDELTEEVHALLQQLASMNLLGYSAS
jgi:PqqD family protein of HPr-rel-A system